ANNTYYQMYNNWDNQCGGGIYWSRDRYTKRENERWYKSSITNAQHVDMGARLYALTGNNAYKNIVDSVYMWMKNMRLIDTDYTVYDGLDARTCDRSGDMYSYHTGELIAGLATLYKVTKEQFYLTEAHHHFNRLASYFAPNGIL
ncbi:glycoside hydrolase, partial [Chytriomyces sp. MP71]